MTAADPAETLDGSSVSSSEVMRRAMAAVDQREVDRAREGNEQRVGSDYYYPLNSGPPSSSGRRFSFRCRSAGEIWVDLSGEMRQRGAGTHLCKVIFPAAILLERSPPFPLPARCMPEATIRSKLAQPTEPTVAFKGREAMQGEGLLSQLSSVCWPSAILW